MLGQRDYYILKCGTFLVISCSFKHGLISELITFFDPTKALKDSDKTIQSLHHTTVQNLIFRERPSI
jgi:hypothetical protein